MIKTTVDIGLPITDKDVLAFTKAGMPVIDGVELTSSEIKVLQEEIKFLENSRIWKVLTTTLSETARQVMFEKAQSFDDMRVGKAILYSNDVKQRMINKIKMIKIIPKEKGLTKT